MPHESFLTTRQATKLRNAFANNMSTDMKLNKAQISKTIQSSGSFGSCFGNLGKKALTNIAIPLAKETSNVMNKFERKISEKGAVRKVKGFSLFIWNEDLNDIIKNKIIRRFRCINWWS